MAGRIDHHAKPVGRRLWVGTLRSQRERFGLGPVQVGHGQVEAEPLRPDRWEASPAPGVEPPVESSFRVLLISGSLRSSSTNTAALRTAGDLAPGRIDLELYTGAAELPHFNPELDVDPPPAAVADLRRRIRAADAVLFSVPEYAGALPGSFKNILDWMIGDAEPGSIAGKPVAWANVSPRGAADAHDSLRKVLGYANARIIEAACVESPATQAMVGENGLIADDSVRRGLAAALGALESWASSPPRL